jgi:benzil reductase ((S)-benzoin forming)
MDLSGKSAVITGASRGIGAGLARVFAARGMRLALCARTPCALPPGAEGITAACDVADESSMRAFAGAAARALDRIDLWINNAGVLEPVGPLRDIPSQAFLDHLRINIMGVVHGSQAFIAHVRASGHQGVLINISSGAAWHGYAGWSAYCAGKAAVDRISETIQLEEGERLRVHAVAPGVIDTDMQALIRSLDQDTFPMVERFRQMKAENSFNSIEFVAEHVLRCAFDPDSRPDAVVTRLPAESAE